MGCPIRKSRDHRSLAAPPSLSQLATSFIACDAKVSTCALLCTLTYDVSPVFGYRTRRTVFFFEIASARARKYAHGPPSCLAHESSSLCSFQGSEKAALADIRSLYVESESKPRGRSLKAEQYSRQHQSSCTRSLPGRCLAGTVRKRTTKSFAPNSSAQP